MEYGNANHCLYYGQTTAGDNLERLSILGSKKSKGVSNISRIGIVQLGVI
jgi:hypothetical protein